MSCCYDVLHTFSIDSVIFYRNVNGTIKLWPDCCFCTTDLISNQAVSAKLSDMDLVVSNKCVWLIDCLCAAMPRSVRWSDAATMAGDAASSEDVDQPTQQQHSSSSAQVLQKTPPKTLRMRNLIYLNG